MIVMESNNINLFTEPKRGYIITLGNTLWSMEMGFFSKIFIALAALTLIYKMLRSDNRKKKANNFSKPDFGKARAEVNKGELVQDALTEVYIAKSEAITHKIDGQDCYFASEENYKKYTKK
jgi:hypothetical protein